MDSAFISRKSVLKLIRDIILYSEVQYNLEFLVEIQNMMCQLLLYVKILKIIT